MKKNISIIALISLLTASPFSAMAASKAPSGSLDKIREALVSKARAADTIAASIKSLEKEIGKVNNKYLERSKQNQSLGEKLEKLKEGLDERLSELSIKEGKAKKIMRLYALEGHDEEDENALLKRTILANLLQKKLDELSSLKQQATSLKTDFEEYDLKLKETRQNEETLYSLIVDLENKKKDLSKKYISSLESKNDLEEKLESALAKQKAYKTIARKKAKAALISMLAPLDDFVNYRGSEKGVTFKYDSRSPVKAGAGGKVVYSGELASYGKVIMIDHGQEVRSVVLGDIELKVKKGENVSQGQVIGYTLVEPGLKKSLYYEVRKKNVAQNTLQWLERGYSKNGDGQKNKNKNIANI